MRLCLWFFCWLGFIGLAWGEAPLPIVVGPGDLTSKGVNIRRRQHNTPSASLEIKVSVEPTSALGEFKLAECVVLKTNTPSDQLGAIDSGAGEAQQLFERRTTSTKPETAFLILGKEISRAYLAIEFLPSSIGANAHKARRFLLPVAAVKAWKPKPASDSESGS